MAATAWFLCLGLLIGALAQSPCDTPDTGRATCKCNGVTYDFSQMKDAVTGNSLFQGPNGDYNYFFEMVNNGLPSSFTGCAFDPTQAIGNAGGQGTKDGQTCYPIGSVSEQTWTITAASETNAQSINVIFSGGQEGRQTSLVVTCDPSTTGVFTARGETAPGSLIYEMDITSCAACVNGCGGGPSPPPPPPPPGPPGPPGPPSPPGPPGSSSSSSSTSLDVGWILVIVLLCSLFVYFVGGMVFLKYKRQASGREMVPNVEFWSSLPGLIKDGFLFTVAKVRRTDYQPL
eukprot:m.102585 g.102585  ORF g.102585 m.102585 type:complete len:288 (+) comp14122_c2_seq1:35-898(+)